MCVTSLYLYIYLSEKQYIYIVFHAVVGVLDANTCRVAKGYLFLESTKRRQGRLQDACWSCWSRRNSVETSGVVEINSLIGLLGLTGFE